MLDGMSLGCSVTHAHDKGDGPDVVFSGTNGDVSGWATS